MITSKEFLPTKLSKQREAAKRERKFLNRADVPSSDLSPRVRQKQREG
jgi:hypothetical protein